MNATTSEITSTKPGITRTLVNFILRRSGNVIRKRSVARWPWRITELALLLGASVIVAGCGGDGSGDSKDGSVLVVGMDLTYPPFEMLNPKGQPDGVSVRLAEGLAKYLGRDLKIENINFDGLIGALKTHKLDCVISSMSVNDKRKQSIDFSDPYLKTPLAMLVSKDSDVQSFDDLKKAGKKVVVRLGTTGEMFAQEVLPDTERAAPDSDTACVMEVVQGKVDAFIYDQLSIYQHSKKHPETTRAVLEPIRHEKWAIGLPKGEDELRQQINEFLKQQREAGAFEELADRYLKDEREMLKGLGVPFVFD